MTTESENRYLFRIALAGSVFTMIYQVAGKTARDGLFLSNFGPQWLPTMVMAGAAVSIALGFAASRLIAWLSPGRVVPVLAVVSALLQGVEWLFYDRAPTYASVAVYLHVVGLAAIINSGFWSVINEQMDPRTAKRKFGRITSAGTAGGIVGGFMAERLSVYASPQSVLLGMSVAHICTALLLFLLPKPPLRAATTKVRARDVLKRSSYVRNLTMLVLIGTFAAALLDYVLKVEARAALGTGEPLMRFFAAFHAGTAVLSFILQLTMTSWFLQHAGLGNAVATVPGSVAAGGILAALSGGFIPVIIVRGLEAVFRGSLFRAGYELFYTPMPAPEKRAVKSINDVTVDRLGDALGGGFTQATVSLLPAAANPLLLLSAASVSGIGWMFARRLNRGYVRSLERGLGARALALDLPGKREKTRIRPARSAPPEPVQRHVDLAWQPGNLASRLADLTAAEPDRVTSALQSGPLERELIPFVLPLLAWAPVSESVAKALQEVAEHNVGQYTDILLDQDVDLAIQVRLPKIIASANNARAVEGLIEGLDDEAYEIRLQCARALDDLHARTELPVNDQRIYEALHEELAIIAMGANVNGTVPASLDYVFALLATVLPHEPVWIAYQALKVNDPQLKGLAFEYLESALTPDLREPLFDVLEPDVPRVAVPRAGQLIAQELMRLRQQIAAHIES